MVRPGAEAMVAAGMRVRVKASCGLCPGRYGVVENSLPGAQRVIAAARGGRWFVGLQRVNPANASPRVELYWGDELEVVG